MPVQIVQAVQSPGSSPGSVQDVERFRSRRSNRSTAVQRPNGGSKFKVQGSTKDALDVAEKKNWS